MVTPRGFYREYKADPHLVDDGANYADYDSDFEGMNDANTGAGNANVDPYSGETFLEVCSRFLALIPMSSPGIFFSKDRKEEVIEIEEIPEMMVVFETNQTVPILTQGQWMRGCPEGGEQSHLFSLYAKLSSPGCPCPQECGATLTRLKGDFFALHVGPFPIFFEPNLDLIALPARFLNVY